MEQKALELIERTLDEVLPRLSSRPAVLAEAMRYAVASGGKRIRPLICLGAAVAAGGRMEDAAYPAAAIELLHNYTLVHDDLPSMDNDVERRGRPTVWKKFGEANAILAGDALEALAFGVAARSPRNSGRIVSALARAGVGVVAGQVEDIEKTGDVDFIYTHKTADLFVAAAEMGALAAGGDEVSVSALSSFALNLGLAFQYQDDLLDGDSPYDRSKTEALAKNATDAAIAALSGLSGDTTPLKVLATRLLGRKI